MFYNMKFFPITLLVFFCFISKNSFAIKEETTHTENTPTSLAESTTNQLLSSIQLHGYVQGGYTYSKTDDQENNTFDIKRSLFWANANITDRWSFLFMHDFSSVVQEFYTDFRITHNKILSVRFGQFKNCLTYENTLSPTSQETIDVYSEGVTYLTGCGSDPLLGVQYGRDLGISIYGETKRGKLRYEFNIMNGQGINKRDGNNSKDFIGKLEYRPIKNLKLIATGQIGKGHAIGTSLYNPNIKEGDNYERNRWSVGFDYKSKQIKAHGEYLEGKDGNTTSRGAYLTTCIPLKHNVLDIIGSYDFFNFNTKLRMDQHKVVAGLQYWFYKNCRLQMQYVFKSSSIKNNVFLNKANNAIMCQIQVRFN